MKRGFIYIFLLTLGSHIHCDMERLQTFKVMTFNIRYGTAKDSLNSWQYRRSILIDCLKQHKPDILATQESMDFQIEFIKAAFPHWKVFGVGRYHGVTEPDRPHESMRGESCKIMYDSTKFEIVKKGTYWHSDTPDVPASKTWGNGLPRITTWGILRIMNNDQQFVVMNTHFHWGEPYVSNTANLIIHKWCEIAGTRPTILLGDFNLEPTSETHDLFCGKSGIDDTQSGFIDCWQALSKVESNAGTGHGFEGSKSRGRIDWILVTPEFKVRDIEIIYDNDNGQYPSDHYPVLAEILELN
jgi:endonuclease/exonuclease/phosphatase family metal-dependent hydrolase